ncbi:MAG: pseudomurein-binding protein [Methanobacterium sp.]|nr:pseudomurein-binding protein [Methanobacterium sp.]
MGHGGGIINRKLSLAVISLLTISLFINVSDVSAANTTFNTSDIIKSSETVKNYVETKHNVPSKVTVGKQNVTTTQYLYLLTSTVGKINKSSSTPITVKNVSKPTNPSESITSGTLTKNEYLQLATKITTFIDKYGRVPNYVSTSLGTIRYENLVYTYSKVLNFYKTNKRLPNTVSVTPWINSEGIKTNSSNVQSIIDSIGNKEAQYEDIQGQSSPTVMEQVGYGDCWADSGWLYNKLSAAGIAVRVMGTTSGGIYYLHRWVEINIGNGWTTWNYNKYNSQHYGALGSGIFVVKTYTP